MFTAPQGTLQPAESPSGPFYYRSQGFSKTFTTGGKFEDTTLTAASKKAKREAAAAAGTTPTRKGGGGVGKWYAGGGTPTRSAQEKENTWLKQQQLKSSDKLAREDYAAEVIQARFKGFSQRTGGATSASPKHLDVPGRTSTMIARARRAGSSVAAATQSAARQRRMLLAEMLNAVITRLRNAWSKSTSLHPLFRSVRDLTGPHPWMAVC